MISLSPPPASTSRIAIDTAFLLRQVATLAQVKWQRRTWDEFGEMILRDLERSSRTVRRTPVRVHPAETPEAVYWRMVKELVFAVVELREERHDEIRKRLGTLQEPSTPRLWSTLTLWLAGVLGISTSVTGPLVAALLYGVAEAGGDWEVLRS